MNCRQAGARLSRQNWALLSAPIKKRIYGKVSPQTRSVVFPLIAEDDLVRDAFDVHCAAVCFVDVDHGAVQDDGAIGDRISDRAACQKTLENGVDIASQNAFDGAAHSGITEESGAAGENLFVGCLGVGVGADNSGDFTVEETAHGDFFAGRFGVHIDEDDVCFFAHASDFRFHDEEGIFERRVHESAALDVDNADLALVGFENDGAVADGAFGVVDRA